MREVEEKRKQQQALKEKEELEKRKQEEELAELEAKRKEELYQSMKQMKEEMRRKEAEDIEKLEVEWISREKKAKAAEKERRNSFNQARSEMKRLAKIAKERSFLKQFASKEDFSLSEEGERKADAAEADVKVFETQIPKSRMSFS